MSLAPAELQPLEFERETSPPPSDVLGFLASCAERFLDFCAWWSAGRWGLFRVALAGVLVAFFSAFPSYDYPELDGPRAKYVQEMIDHGVLDYWSTIDASTNVNGRAVMYRITVPLVARLFGLSLIGCLVLQGLAGCLLLYLVAFLADRITADRVAACLFCWSISSIWAGYTAFVDLRGVFDGIALMLVVAALCLRSPAPVFCLMLAALFTDERTALAAGFGLLLTFYLRDHSALSSWAKMAAMVLAVVVYGVIRLGVQKYYHLPSQETRSLSTYVNNSALGAWTAFEGGWALVAMALVVLVRARSYTLASAYFTLLLAGMIAGVIVDDITRGMAYMLPALFLALAVVSTDLSSRRLHWMLFACCAASVLWPSYYISFKSHTHWNFPLPIQLLRWTFGGGADLGLQHP